ncbi:MAG: hypothetical protein ACXQS1_00775, partial [Methermicoccaceae archaeon]
EKSTSSTPAFFMQVEPIVVNSSSVSVFACTVTASGYVQYAILRGMKVGPVPIIEQGISDELTETPPLSPTSPTTPTPEQAARTFKDLLVSALVVLSLGAVVPLFPLLNLIPVKKAVVLDTRGSFSAVETGTFDVVYVPQGEGEVWKPGSEISDWVVPATVPESLASSIIYKQFDIPVSSGRAIAVAVEYGSTVYLSNAKAVKVALGLGLEAYLKEVMGVESTAETDNLKERLKKMQSRKKVNAMLGAALIAISVFLVELSTLVLFGIIDAGEVLGMAFLCASPFSMGAGLYLLLQPPQIPLE